MTPRESTGTQIPLQQYQKADQGLPKHSDIMAIKLAFQGKTCVPPEVCFCLEVYLSRSARAMPWLGPSNTYAGDEDPSTGWLFSISNGFGQGPGGLNPAADDLPAEGITPSGKGRATDYTPHKDIPGNNSTKRGPSRHLLTSTGEVT